MANKAPKASKAKKSPNPVGAPPMFRSARQMQVLIDRYFNECSQDSDGGSRSPTVPGLALALGFSHRSSVHDYKRKPRFAAAITRALSKMEDRHLGNLAAPDTKNARGIQFALTANFGYSDEKTQRILNGLEIMVGATATLLRRFVAEPSQDEAAAFYEGQIAKVRDMIAGKM